MKIPQNEMIHCESFYDLADYHYKEQDDLPSGVVHVDMGSIPDFFRKIDNNGKDYIVISSRADFCVCYQQEHPVFADIHKAARMFAQPEWGYARKLELPPRCNLDRCHPQDKFSIKCYSWTEATFSHIPVNVKHWFACNNMTRENNITSIPFGINGTDGNLECIDKIYNYPSKDKDGVLYVNFQFYTNERFNYFKYFREHSQATIERDISFDKFLDRLASHMFCLCPIGNGIDCFRTYESLYMECIPILELECYYSMPFLRNLPVLFVPSFYSINLESLKELYNKHFQYFNDNKFNFDTITLSYWKNKIEKVKRFYGL